MKSARSLDEFLQEADAFFMETGKLHQTLLNLTRRLDEAAIPYAVLDAIALGRHGHQRMTVDIDLLLTREGLAQFTERWLGRGYTPAFPGAEKSFRAADTGVRIDIIATGEYPGDGRPKPVVFPNPAEASVEIRGVRVVTLEKLIELKLASGMSAPHRRRDLADVQDTIRTLQLPQDFAGCLDPSVRPLYDQIWQEAQIPDPIDGV
jgi:hypothetical protein